jgi:bifunctional enzyme CysN/CysC
MSDEAPLRFLTCGSVDGGKSTLIGRLLAETGQIFDDHLETLKIDSRRHSTSSVEVDYSLLLDGLEAEREQHITIDVAYRRFATSCRAFIVADTPGHEQYTRNMATGASNSDVAVVLVDAEKGILAQTRRHTTICALMGIRSIALAVNKIDLVAYDQQAFERIADDYQSFASGFAELDVMPIPLSALHGDNVATHSPQLAWYSGPTLLHYLETVDMRAHLSTRPFRFPVQWVNRPNASFRGISGTIVSGEVTIGDEVMIAPSGHTTRIVEIVSADGDVSRSGAGDAVTLVLEDDIDVGRGNLLAAVREPPIIADQFAAHVIWFGRGPLLPGRTCLMRIGANWISVSVTSIEYKLSTATRERLEARTLTVNDIGFCTLATAAPVAFDAYAENRDTGNFILVDSITHETLAAGMIAVETRRATNVRIEPLAINKSARAAMKSQRPSVLWLTGLPGSGKSTIGRALEARLHRLGRHTMMLDGDSIRLGLNRDLGFTDADRVENIRRAGQVAKLMTDAGLIVICAFISPFAADRQLVRGLFAAGEFVEIFVDTPIEECIRRDPKGLYAKAAAALIPNLTGIHSRYERPEAPELVVRTVGRSVERIATDILSACRFHIVY